MIIAGSAIHPEVAETLPQADLPTGPHSAGKSSAPASQPHKDARTCGTAFGRDQAPRDCPPASANSQLDIMKIIPRMVMA